MQTHNKLVTLGNFKLIRKKAGQRIEHTFAVVMATVLYIRWLSYVMLKLILE